MKPYARFVALGDSQTEGLLDGDETIGYRGWADRFADLVADTSPHLLYANLAIRGKRVGEVRAEQLGVAVAMRPDLVTVMGGLNDLIRPSFDLDAALAHLDAMLGSFGDATVLTNTFPDLAAIAPLFRRLAPRVVAFNAGIRELAARHGASLVDVAARGAGTDLRMWSADRIHANSFGHALIAAAFADTLGLPGFASWSDPLPARVRPGVASRTGTELGWLARSVLPWLGRRVRGRSSGDGRVAKRPRLVPVAPIYHLVDPWTWAAAGTAGEYRPPSLASEGFVHFSFADQVAATADRHYADASALIAVEVAGALLDAEVRVADSYGSGTAYPHLYGPVPMHAVTGTHRLAKRDGRWQFSPAGAAAAASPDR